MDFPQVSSFKLLGSTIGSVVMFGERRFGCAFVCVKHQYDLVYIIFYTLLLQVADNDFSTSQIISKVETLDKMSTKSTLIHFHTDTYCTFQLTQVNKQTLSATAKSLLDASHINELTSFFSRPLSQKGERRNSTTTLITWLISDLLWEEVGHLKRVHPTTGAA